MSIMSMLVAGGGGAFTPLSLFSGGVQGVWYDASDLTTMFQDSTRTTPVGTPGNGSAQPVGLLLDKSQGLLPSTNHAEMQGVSGQYFSTPYKSITTADIDIKVRYQPASFAAGATVYAQDNGTGRNFLTTVDPTKTISLSWWDSGGTYRSVSSSVAASISTGVTYWFRFTLLANNGSGGHDVKFYCNADTGSNTEPTSWTQLGTTVNAGAFTTSIRSQTTPSWVGANYTTGTNNPNGKLYFVSASNTIGGAAVQAFTPANYTSGTTFTSTTSDVWTINGTTYIVPDGNHASQSTSSARPTLSALYNLLTYTEQFDNAAWPKANASVTADQTTAPDGTNTADFLKEDSATNRHIVYQNPAAASAANYTFSVCAKAASRSFISVLLSDAVSHVYAAIFDLTNGIVTSTNTGNSPTGTSNSITSLGNGWYRCTIKMDCNSGSFYQIIGLSDSGTPSSYSFSSPSYTGNGTSGCYIWGADCRVSNDGVGLPAYQRVVDSLTYDAVGFPYYLVLNGGGQTIVASSLNLSSTDKATVWSSHRVLTNTGNWQGIYEFSPDPGSNNGSFGFFKPTGPSSYYSMLRGTAFIDAYTPTSFAIPITNISEVSLDIGQSAGSSEMTVRINSSAQTLTYGGAADAGTGNFGSYALNIGSRNATTYWLAGRIYGLIIRGAASTATEISNTETWLNGKTKAY